MPKGGRRSTSFKRGVSGNPQQIAEFARLSQERMDSAKAAQLARPQIAQGDQVGRASSTAATQENLRQVDALSGGRGNEGGNRAAALELGLTEQEVRRSRTIDSITPRAKEAAREAGLDRNQSEQPTAGGTGLTEGWSTSRARARAKRPSLAAYRAAPGVLARLTLSELVQEHHD